MPRAMRRLVATGKSEDLAACVAFIGTLKDPGVRVKALGGGWDASTLPAPGAVLSRGGARTAAHGPDDER